MHFMLFLLLMPVFPQTLLALVGSHLMPLSLLSAWHLSYFLTWDLTLVINVLAGLNAGML